MTIREKYHKEFLLIAFSVSYSIEIDLPMSCLLLGLNLVHFLIDDFLINDPEFTDQTSDLTRISTVQFSQES